jgi:hypothetical protein
MLAAVVLTAGEVQEVQRIASLPRWEGTRVEVRQWDGTRVDMLTETHAIEADWSHKWAEAIGQALYYAELTQRAPGIVLLVKDRKAEARYIYRCQTVCAKHGIRLWIEDVDEK